MFQRCCRRYSNHHIYPSTLNSLHLSCAAIERKSEPNFINRIYRIHYDFSSQSYPFGSIQFQLQAIELFLSLLQHLVLMFLVETRLLQEIRLQVSFFQLISISRHLLRCTFIRRCQKINHFLIFYCFFSQNQLGNIQEQFSLSTYKDLLELED